MVECMVMAGDNMRNPNTAARRILQEARERDHKARFVWNENIVVLADIQRKQKDDKS